MEDIENSRPFDVHRWSDYPEIRTLTDHLLQELFLTFPNNATKGKRKKALRVLLLDLYCCWQDDPVKYIGINLNKNRYLLGTRYNKLYLRYEPIKACFDRLLALGYIDIVPGTRHPRPGQGRVTRMRATDKLRNVFVESDWVLDHAKERLPDEVIWVRDPNTEKLLDYKDTVKTRQMRSDLEAYNALMAYVDIDVLYEGNPFFGTPEFIYEDVKLHRIFGNRRFNQGGRFYGAHYQHAEYYWRLFIVFDGSETVEIDYKSLHPTFAYASAGVDFYALTGLSDMYLTQDFGYSKSDKEMYRALVKKTFLTLLNANSEVQAAKSVMKKVKKNYLDQDAAGGPHRVRYAYPRDVTYYKVRDLINWIRAQHPSINHLFCTELGPYFQFIDSEISNRVLMKMIGEGRPVLPVHDSFICKTEDQARLSEIMHEAFAEQMNLIGYRAVEVRLKTTTA